MTNTSPTEQGSSCEEGIGPINHPRNRDYTDQISFEGAKAFFSERETTTAYTG